MTRDEYIKDNSSNTHGLLPLHVLAAVLTGVVTSAAALIYIIQNMG